MPYYRACAKIEPSGLYRRLKAVPRQESAVRRERRGNVCIRFALARCFDLIWQRPCIREFPFHNMLIRPLGFLNAHYLPASIWDSD